MDAFISNSREDSDFVVDRLRKALRERRQQVWLDVDITGGAKWRVRVMRAIEACWALIFVISPASVASDACSQELDDAVALNKMVVLGCVPGKPMIDRCFRRWPTRRLTV